MENYNRIEKDENGIYYYLNDKLNRVDGPAVYDCGDKFWYQNGLKHRDNGPAVELYDGDMCWYKNGLRHRIDGPAIERTNGYKEWWFEGKQIDCKSQKEFERLIKLKLFW